MSRPRRFPTALGLGLASCLFAAPARGQDSFEEALGMTARTAERSAAKTAAPVHAAVEPALEVLRLLRDPEAPPIAELAERIDVNVPEVVPGLLSVLESGRVPASAGEPEQILSIFQEQLILAVFGRAGYIEVHAAVDAWRSTAGAERDPQAVATAIAALGAVDGSTDLRDLMARALPEGVEQLEPEVADALEGALVSVAGRHDDALGALGGIVHLLDPQLFEVIARAVGETRDPRGIGLLGDLLDRDASLAGLVAPQVRSIGASRRLYENDRLAAALRPHLGMGESNLQRSVMLALAELEDYEAVPFLIEALDSTDHGLREDAHWALARLTDLHFGPQASRWKAWYDQELEWSRRGRSVENLRLDSSSQANAAQAIREYSRHRLFRHELALDVERVLRRSETSLRIAACETLAQLGSVQSMPALVELMADPRSALKEAATDALRRISGRDLSGDRGAWMALLDAEF